MAPVTPSLGPLDYKGKFHLKKTRSTTILLLPVIPIATGLFLITGGLLVLVTGGLLAQGKALFLETMVPQEEADLLDMVGPQDRIMDH